MNEIIKSNRKLLNMTQQELADKIFKTRANVSMWETGHRKPRTHDVVRLCKALNISLNELFEVVL